MVTKYVLILISYIDILVTKKQYFNKFRQNKNCNFKFISYYAIIYNKYDLIPILYFQGHIYTDFFIR